MPRTAGTDMGAFMDDLKELRDSFKDPILLMMFDVIFLQMIFVQFTIRFLDPYVNPMPGACENNSQHHGRKAALALAQNPEVPVDEIPAHVRCDSGCMCFNECMKVKVKVDTVECTGSSSPNGTGPHDKPCSGISDPQAGPWFLVWGRITCEACALKMKAFFDPLLAAGKFGTISFIQVTIETDIEVYRTGLGLHQHDIILAILQCILKTKRVVAKNFPDVAVAAMKFHRISKLDASFFDEIRGRALSSDELKDEAAKTWHACKAIWELMRKHIHMFPWQSWDENWPGWKPVDVLEDDENFYKQLRSI